MARKKQKKPGRPAGRNYELIGITIDPKIRAEMIAYAESTGGTVSASLRPILERGWKEFKRDLYGQSELKQYTGGSVTQNEASHEIQDS